ncbi:hypothetical protein ACLKA6_003383 [Drosophila palustris]
MMISVSKTFLSQNKYGQNRLKTLNEQKQQQIDDCKLSCQLTEFEQKGKKTQSESNAMETPTLRPKVAINIVNQMEKDKERGTEGHYDDHQQ